jgi:hypothetical protein
MENRVGGGGIGCEMEFSGIFQLIGNALAHGVSAAAALDRRDEDGMDGAEILDLALDLILGRGCLRGAHGGGDQQRGEQGNQREEGRSLPFHHSNRLHQAKRKSREKCEIFREPG